MFVLMFLVYKIDLGGVSGVYKIFVAGDYIDVYCDMEKGQKNKANFYLNKR